MSSIHVDTCLVWVSSQENFVNDFWFSRNSLKNQLCCARGIALLEDMMMLKWSYWWVISNVFLARAFLCSKERFIESICAAFLTIDESHFPDKMILYIVSLPREWLVNCKGLMELVIRLNFHSPRCLAWGRSLPTISIFFWRSRRRFNQSHPSCSQCLAIDVWQMFNNVEWWNIHFCINSGCTTDIATLFDADGNLNIISWAETISRAW